MKTISREQIIDLLADGKAIVIYEQNVLNLTSWIIKHPGGDKAVQHMIGRDATDEMNAYHSLESVATFKNWRIGKIDHPWQNLLPPIQGAIYVKGKYDIPTEHFIKVSSSLDKKLDQDSSDVDISTSSSILEEEVENKGFGYPKVKVLPKVPQNTMITKDNEDRIFPVLLAKSTIVNPKMLMESFDNGLSKQLIEEMPSLDYDTQNGLREKYQKLHDIVIENNFYECNLSDYGRELIKIASLYMYAFSFLKLGYYKLSAIFIGMAWHQMTFIAHDAGHVSITHNYQIDNLFGMLIANWFGGLSLGWWKRNHNVHHLITNDPVHDPDIQHLPFFAVSVRLFENVYSTYYDKILDVDQVAKWMLPIQNYTYYPILCFGRFNLYRLSWMHLIMGDGPRQGKAAWFRYFETLGLSFFFYWFFYLVVWRSVDGGWNRFAYVMISHVATMLVHVQITLSHFAMSTADLGVSESFPSRQLRTTMDVDCPEWFDFFHGGLQFQVIHHLFPRLPRHNFRKVQPYVIKFCEECGLKYSIYGFGEGNEIVIGKLGEIAKQFSIMMDATKAYDGELV
jgi:delta8-fatty-acid desaturase